MDGLRIMVVQQDGFICVEERISAWKILQEIPLFVRITFLTTQTGGTLIQF